MELAGESQQKNWLNPIELFKRKEIVKICAPMVRYSKLPFRCLVRRYGCDLAFTPMIVSDSFIQSQKARDSDFTTNASDRPLVVQFASKCAKDFADATELIVPFSDGVDMNCGCPQRWAMKAGYGAYLIQNPQLIEDMVKQTKQRVPNDFPISIKIRIHHNTRETVDVCRKAEHAGVSWITVHGRTIEQRSQPCSYETIKLIKDSVSIPVVANGDIRNDDDIAQVKEATGVDGVMAARGILVNPAMYAGYKSLPIQCLQDWIDISLSIGISYTHFHHHLMFMLKKVLGKQERRVFNSLTNLHAVLQYIEENFGITRKMPASF
ncbi:tRNA-dihydrouridine(20a/20b) synthase [NAD(P)+]-like isoform X1 [Xenia sp. Carnegie-2017]|uniref:tRNA-dihydrouridine(20a/20b) synthase [NAD(P)+]-like isoform X1 n=1 Tax=Xenia sp. Carnegie-2017 TaxID=2897299 RepID=UPI001F04B5D4|nr:tRNA-dihydrouridine(20a/20b) synthase [NAD(P)+]-like isoform X1 [Xenia sp. Carnegie-2017]